MPAFPVSQEIRRGAENKIICKCICIYICMYVKFILSLKTIQGYFLKTGQFYLLLFAYSDKFLNGSLIGINLLMSHK